MSQLEAVELHIKQQALARYDRFAPAPIATVLSPSPAFRRVPDAHITFLLTHQADVRRWFRRNADPAPPSDVLDFFTSRIMLRYLYAHNQFLDIPRHAVPALRSIYARFIVGYLSVACELQDRATMQQALDAVLAEHQSRLAGFVRELGISNGGMAFALAEPVCSEYSAALQLDLLGVSVGALQEPILDLGCGVDARLVHYLRERGKQAVGVERNAGNVPGAVKLDWFDFPFSPGQWGTVISHMAFSTHFTHHHLRRNGHPEAYARLYMRILQSLKPGGQFIYTPGLPFIEQLLPAEQYDVHRRAIDRAPALPGDALLDGSNYAAEITRR